MYALGIDLGTTYTAAAVWRDGRAQIVSLGGRGAAIPSVVLLREDETFLTGEAANRRGLTEPGRVAREFKRRLGDTTPLMLGGTPYSAEALTSQLLRAVVAEVTTREGGPPSTVCVSHPANWGPYKIDLLRQAMRMADLPSVSFVTEPEAAAVNYAAEQRLGVGAQVAVYDLGGGTFDAAVLRRTTGGFTILGQPEGIERLGGIDFDAAVFNHVRTTLGSKLDDLDDDDAAVISAVARLREECVQAKEALSADTDTTIPVLLPSVTTEVRLTRGELEAMVRPALHGSIEALRRAVRSAGLTPEQLHSVLLVGGSSRMPIVGQLVTAELGRPVAVDTHPKHAVALGAARLAGGGFALPAGGGRGAPGAGGAAGLGAGAAAAGAGGGFAGAAGQGAWTGGSGAGGRVGGVAAGSGGEVGGAANPGAGHGGGAAAGLAAGGGAAGGFGSGGGAAGLAGGGPGGGGGAAGLAGAAGQAAGQGAWTGGPGAGGRVGGAAAGPGGEVGGVANPGAGHGGGAAAGLAAGGLGGGGSAAGGVGGGGGAAGLAGGGPGGSGGAAGPAADGAGAGFGGAAGQAGVPSGGPGGAGGAARLAGGGPTAGLGAGNAGGRGDVSARGAAGAGAGPASGFGRTGQGSGDSAGPGSRSGIGAVRSGRPGNGPRADRTTHRFETGSDRSRDSGGAVAPPRESPRRRRTLVLAAGVVALVLLGGAGVGLAVLGGDDRGSGTGGPTTTASNSSLPVDEQCTDAIMSNPRWVCLTSAIIADGRITIDYRGDGAPLKINGDYHLHIYGGDGVNPPADIMGGQAPESEQGKWYMEDRHPAVLDITDERFRTAIGDAPKVCARIADAKHHLVPDKNGTFVTGNCVSITRTEPSTTATKATPTHNTPRSTRKQTTTETTTTTDSSTTTTTTTDPTIVAPTDSPAP